MNKTDQITNPGLAVFDQHRDILACLLLATVTLAVYWRVQSYDFVAFDDNVYFTQNQYVQAGLTLEGITWSFTNTITGMWIPITWLSYMVGSHWLGLSPGWHHLTNVLLHLLNILLLFLLLRRLTHAFWPRAWVAVLFALHPIHVESVAWITERKDVLSTFFCLLAIWGYCRYVDRPRALWYVLSLTFFALGLMAKPMIVTLPFVLILLDFWPLKRLQSERMIANGNSNQDRRLLPLVLEKTPFFILAAAVSWVTFGAHHQQGGIGSLEAIPLNIRIMNALVAYFKYLGKLIWPAKLAVLYPYPEMPTGWLVAGALMLLAGISWLAISNRYRRPYLIVGWLWYLGTLVPVIGLVQAGTQAMADRFVYIPFMGLYIAMTWGLYEWVSRRIHRRIWLGALSIMLLAVLCSACWKQVGYWQNSVTLFERTLKVTSNNWLMHNNFAGVLAKLGRTDEAIEHYWAALRIKPDYVEAYYNLGGALANQGRTDEAIENYLKALQLDPDYVEAHYNLGNTLENQGRRDEAVKHYLAALRLDPDHVKAHNNLGVILFREGDFKGAVEHFREALRISPDHASARSNLKRALVALKGISQ